MGDSPQVNEIKQGRQVGINRVVNRMGHFNGGEQGRFHKRRHRCRVKVLLEKPTIPVAKVGAPVLAFNLGTGREGPDTVRVTFEDCRAVLQIRHDEVGNTHVIAEEVALGKPLVRPIDFFQVCQFDRLARAKVQGYVAGRRPVRQEFTCSQFVHVSNLINLSSLLSLSVSL